MKLKTTVETYSNKQRSNSGDKYRLVWQLLTTSYVTHFPSKSSIRKQTKNKSWWKHLQKKLFSASGSIDLWISSLCRAKESLLNTPRKIPTLHFNLCCGGTRSNSLPTHNIHEKKAIKLSNGRESCLGASWQRRDTNVMEHTCDFGKGKGARMRHRDMSTVCLCVSVQLSESMKSGKKVAQIPPA